MYADSLTGTGVFIEHIKQENDYICNTTMPSMNGKSHMYNVDTDVHRMTYLPGLLGIKMEWCNSGELLAVAGQRLDGDSTPGVFTNMVHFYTSQGELRYSSQLPCRTVSTAVARLEVRTTS